jgi:diguanylate cyclase (GGDEF)-like protein
MKLSLRTKILLLIAGTTSGLAALVLATLGVLTQRGIDAAVHADARATGGMLTQLIHERTDTLTNECRLLADLPILKAVAETGDPTTMSDTARDSLGQIDADSVMVTDRNGSLLAITDGGQPLKSMVSGDAGVAAAMNGGEWSGIVSRRGQLVLAVSVPIKMGPVVWGTFSAYRRIDSRVARQLRDDLGTDVAFIVDGNVAGASVVIPDRFTVHPGTPAVVDINGISYVALYAPMPNGNAASNKIGFVTLKPYDAAIAPYRNLRIAFIAIFALALALSLIVGAMAAERLIKPLDGLVTAAKTLSDGDWPEHIDVQRTDEIGLLQSVFNDMTTAMRDGREKLLALIDIDQLTGLINHRKFHERLAEETRRSRASGEPLTLMRVNIDGFHEFNQLHGHAAGDQALQMVAHVIQERLPELSIVSRFAGDEFAVLLPNRPMPRAIELSESIRKAVEAMPAIVGQPLSVSVGVAEFGTHSKRSDGLILAAELAVSRAKSLGRNRVCGFDSVPGADETADPYQLHRFLKDESLATIQALAAAVDAKDTYTRGHSQSVAQYATDLARIMGFSQSDIQLVHTAGTLHDVGKIGVPDDILKKPGRLTDEERTVMETHPVLGELIVRKVPSLAGILPGVRHHHERWDGRGYPDKLAGERIPYIARILAVADSFDAMTSDRPYRKGMAFDIALHEIERGSGSQFDPELAGAFLSMMRERELPRVA